MAQSSFTKFPARFGKYILLDRINSGGMAEVFRAKVTGVEQFQRIIAIKTMLPGLMEDEQFVTMFIDEAKLSSQLSHANIVQIYELGSIDDRLFIAMELINGRDLRHVLKIATKKKIKLPQSFASYILAKAAEGLDFAHHKTGLQGEPLNLVHRDVSPQNILISYDGEVKVVDFGIAKAEERATETRAGVLKGKFAYMAPEQVMGQPIDARADIFALGAVFFETLTGRKLFSGESDLSILDKVRNATIPDFSVDIPEAPDELYEVLRTALSKDVATRYGRASDMAESLEPLLIDDRKIFGTKRAREFMIELFSDEIEELAERTRRYTQITDADCEGDPVETESKTEIFESAFSGEMPRQTVPLGDKAQRAVGARPRTGSHSGVRPRTGSNSGVRPRTVRPRTGTSPRKQTTGGLDSDLRARMPTGEGDFGVARPRMPTGESDLTADGDQIETRPLGEEATEATNDFFSDGATAVADPAMSPLPPTEISDEAEESPPDEGKVVLPPHAVKVVVPKSVVFASIGAALTMTALVLYVVIEPLGLLGFLRGTDAPDATQTDDLAAGQIVEVNTAAGDTPTSTQHAATPTNMVATTTTRSTASKSPKSPPPAEPSRPATPPPPSARVDPKPQPRTAEAQPDAAKDKPRKKRKIGYVKVMASGVKVAKIFLNNKPVGKSPLLRLKVPVGKHKIKIVEQLDGKPGRTKNLSIDVTLKHTRNAPLKIFVPL